MEDVNVDKENTAPRKVNPKIFGREIASIPCFRNSFIFGICTGVAGGLIAFMMTSKAMFSSHTAFASLWAGVFAYWIPCRYKHESTVLVAEYWKENFKKVKESRENSEGSSSADSTEKKE